MPTHNDETLHDRYAREHADHMARLAKMTPEQIAEMELSLHNAMAELDRLRAQLPSQGGEAVAWHTEDHLTDKSATTYDPEVAKRWRAKGWPVTPLYTHQADQVEDGVVVSRELLKSWVTGLQCGIISQRHVVEELRAQLASLEVKS